MPSDTHQAHKPHREIHLSNDKRVIATSEETVHTVRRQYQESEDDVEVVIYGSPEHIECLKRSATHHEKVRDELRERHGSAFDDCEAVHSHIDSVAAQLRRLEDHTGGIHANYGRFGFNPKIRAYDETEDDEAAAGGQEPKGNGNVSPQGGSTTIKLARRPTAQQWYHLDVLWRSSEWTEVMAIELFFDLIYVGIIHSNGEHLSEEPTGHELLRFCVTFIMSWIVWYNTVYMLSCYASNDVLSRTGILYEIACLVGFTTNMINSFSEDAEHNTYTQLVSYFLAARFLYVVHDAIAIYLVPVIRGVLWLSIISAVVPCALWIASIHVVDLPGRLALVWLALTLDLYGSLFTLWSYVYARNEKNQSRLAESLRRIFDFFPAMSIEHSVERMNAFVSLVFGYSVVGVLFQVNGGYSVNVFLGKAVISMMQSFFFNWLYFDIDNSAIVKHACRTSSKNAFVWHAFHLPFIMAYIVASAALSTLVLASDIQGARTYQLVDSYAHLSEEHFGLGVRFFYCHGLAIALLCMTVVASSHTHVEKATMRLRKLFRTLNRVAVCLVMFLLPLARSLNSLHLISVTMGLVVWALAVELWGRSCTDESCLPSKRDTSRMHRMAKAAQANAAAATNASKLAGAESGGGTDGSRIESA